MKQDDPTELVNSVRAAVNAGKIADLGPSQLLLLCAFAEDTIRLTKRCGDLEAVIASHLPPNVLAEKRRD